MAKKITTKVLLGVLLVLAVCTSMASAQGGKEFYLAFMEWHSFQYPNLRSMAVSLTNPNNASVQVYVDFIGLTEPQQVRTLASGEFVTLELTHDVSMDSGSGKYQKSVRISSSDDIFVQANPEYNQPSVTGSASGFAVLPTHLLTSDYIVATHCKTNKCVLAVTSAEDGNTVQVHFRITSDGKAGYGEILYGDDSVLYESLDKGETMQVTCDVCDMTGTWVTSSKKVAVFAGGTFTKCDGSRSRKDAVAEQMVPTERLGTSFVLGSNLFAPILREKIKVVLLCVGDSFTYGGNVYTATRDRHRFVLSKRDMANVATIIGTNKMLVAELMCGLNNLDMPDVSISIALPQESWSVDFVGYVPYLDSSLYVDSAFISLVIPASVQPDWIVMGNVSEVNVTTDGDYTLLCLRYTEYGLKELMCTHPKCKPFWGFVTHIRKLRSSVYSLTPLQTGLELQTSLPTCHATTVTWGSTSNDDSTTRTTKALQVPNSSHDHSDTPLIHMTGEKEITTQNNVTTQNDVDDTTPSIQTSTVTTTENSVVTTDVSAKALDDTISTTADNESNVPIQSVSVTEADSTTSSDVSLVSDVTTEVVSHQAEVTSTNIMSTHSDRTTAGSMTATQNSVTTQSHTTTDDDATTQGHTTTDDDATTQSHSTTDDDATTQGHTTTDDDATTQSHTTTDDDATTQGHTTTDDDVTTQGHTTTDDDATTQGHTTTDDDVTTQDHTTTDDDATTQGHTTTDDDATTQGHTTTDDDVTTQGHTTTDDDATTQSHTTTDDDATTQGHTTTDDDVTTQGHTTTDDDATTQGHTTTDDDVTTQGHTTTDDDATTQGHTTTDHDATTQGHTTIDDDATTQSHTTTDDDATTQGHTTIDDDATTKSHTTIDDDVTVLTSTLTSAVGYTESSTATQTVSTSDLVSDTSDATDNGNNLFIQSLSTTETEKTTSTDVNKVRDVTTPGVPSSAAYTEGDATSQYILRTELDTVTPSAMNMDLTTQGALSTETVITTTALSNSYSDVITQNVTTYDVNATTQQNTNTTANNNNRPSSRRCQCVKNGHIPEEEKKTITRNVTAVIKRYLAEDRKNMSAYIRTKVSAADERISPLIIGTTLGIVTCVVVILLFPVSDLLRHAFYLY